MIEDVEEEISTSVGDITLIVAYCPAQATTESTNTLQRDKLTRRQGQYLIAGDLNAKHQAWGNTRRNQNGTISSNDLEVGRYNILS